MPVLSASKSYFWYENRTIEITYWNVHRGLPCYKFDFQFSFQSNFYWNAVPWIMNLGWVKSLIRKGPMDLVGTNIFRVGELFYNLHFLVAPAEKMQRFCCVVYCVFALKIIRLSYFLIWKKTFHSVSALKGYFESIKHILISNVFYT